ncbi:glutathione S-transferase [Jannaschia sp. Os4]|nr:glutathione S-transferase [Jannaschia sp. Os4]
MTLHLARGTIALAAHAALEVTGLDHRLAWVDFRAAEQRGEAYARVNPKGRVPALETDRGILTETPAILEWIAQAAPDAGLMPADPWQAAKARAWMAWCASTAHVNHAHKMRGARWADDEAAWAAMTAKVPQTMLETARFAEAGMEGAFLLGDAPTVADLHWFAIARWLEGDGVDLSAVPGVAAHMSRMREVPGVARAEAMHG